jgi:hypothetical protein
MKVLLRKLKFQYLLHIIDSTAFSRFHVLFNKQLLLLITHWNFSHNHFYRDQRVSCFSCMSTILLPFTFPSCDHEAVEIMFNTNFCAVPAFILSFPLQTLDPLQRRTAVVRKGLLALQEMFPVIILFCCILINNVRLFPCCDTDHDVILAYIVFL